MTAREALASVRLRSMRETSQDYLGRRRVASAAQMRELDRLAIEDRGVPSLVLMENASRAAADVALELCGRGGVLILCGPGNNGGDGLAMARTLWNRGHEVSLVRVGAAFDHPDRLTADVQAQLRLLPDPLVRSSVEVRDDVPDELETLLEGCGLLVDALFGIGLARPLEGPFAATLEAAARSGARKLAVDLPSGLDADSGSPLGPALTFDATVTFAAWKSGLLRGSGPRLAGDVRVAEIGIPRDLLESLEVLDLSGLGHL